MAKKDIYGRGGGQSKREKRRQELEGKLMDVDPLRRVNFDIPLSLRTQFKAKVAAEGKTMGEVMVALVREYLAG